MGRDVLTLLRSLCLAYFRLERRGRIILRRNFADCDELYRGRSVQKSGLARDVKIVIPVVPMRQSPATNSR